MSYRVVSSHPESLRDGRTVVAGDRVSDADAKKNPRLVEREVLVKEESAKSQAKQEASEPKPAQSPAPEQGEEDSK